MTLVGGLDGDCYNLRIEDESPTTAIGVKAAMKLRKAYSMVAHKIRIYKL